MKQKHGAVEEHQTQQGNLWVLQQFRSMDFSRVQSPAEKLLLLLLLGFCQLQALDPESAVVFLGPNTSWLSGPFQAFTQLEGHLPPLLAQL